MKKEYFIMKIYKIGSIGGCDINKVKDQPKEGFKTEKQAETYLKELFKSNKYPYNSGLNDFSIMPMYKIMK